mmetsp:Transcript_4459/g.6325  ORF Transcript_4459/g.6325 Transcript_4459/m.6325 type:complete len:213 (+) Transcript_4459:35-673(+)
MRMSLGILWDPETRPCCPKSTGCRTARVRFATIVSSHLRCFGEDTTAGYVDRYFAMGVRPIWSMEHYIMCRVLCVYATTASISNCGASRKVALTSPSKTAAPCARCWTCPTISPFPTPQIPGRLHSRSPRPPCLVRGLQMLPITIENLAMRRLTRVRTGRKGSLARNWCLSPSPPGPMRKATVVIKRLRATAWRMARKRGMKGRERRWRRMT